MTKGELVKIMAYLFADFDAEVKREKFQVWFDLFKDIPERVGWSAARICMSRKSFGLPKAQDFAAAIQEVLRPEGRELTGAEAFNLAYKAAGRYGEQYKDKALAILPPLVAKAAIRFGWRELRLAGSPELVRGQFARIYDSLAAQASADMTLPEDLRREIAEIRRQQKEITGPERAKEVIGRVFRAIENRAKA